MNFDRRQPKHQWSDIPTKCNGSPKMMASDFKAILRLRWHKNKNISTLP